jgi:hypothetical protein
VIGNREHAPAVTITALTPASAQRICRKGRHASPQSSRTQLLAIHPATLIDPLKVTHQPAAQLIQAHHVHPNVHEAAVNESSRNYSVQLPALDHSHRLNGEGGDVLAVVSQIVGNVDDHVHQEHRKCDKRYATDELSEAPGARRLARRCLRGA